MLICAYENRSECEPAVRLLIGTLSEYAPQFRIRLYHNPASSNFDEWIKGYPQVDFRKADLSGDLGWNVKPQVLLEALGDGEDQVLWLDSDLLVARDFGELFSTIPPDTLIGTEEALWGGRDDTGGKRTLAWGLPVGRTLPYTLNSAVLRVSKVHVPLLRRWLELLQTETYREAQATPWQSRSPLMMGDQDVLTALLCSEEFSSIHVRLLRRGREILQLFGPVSFTLLERWNVLRRGLPPFVHAQGNKPWRLKREEAHGSINKMFKAYLDTSPYVLLAIRHRNLLAADGWLMPRTHSGKLMRRLGFGTIEGSGLPLAIIFDLMFATIKLKKKLY